MKVLQLKKVSYNEFSILKPQDIKYSKALGIKCSFRIRKKDFGEKLFGASEKMNISNISSIKV